MPFIHVDPNTLQLKISSNIDDPYIPSEDTIAIKMLAKQLAKFRDDFVEKQYNPKVDNLMKLVMEYNAKSDPNIAKQLKEIQDKKKKEAKDQMTPKEPKLKVAKQGASSKKKTASRKPPKK